MHAYERERGAPGAGDEPTHAGGIVWRRLSAGIQFLLVRALPRPDGAQPAPWVLPKGHVEPHEEPERTALREVLEEAGAVAELGPLAGTLHFNVGAEAVRCAFYAMELLGQREPQEPRELRWASLDEVRRLVPFPATVALVESVAERLAERAGGPPA